LPVAPQPIAPLKSHLSRLKGLHEYKQAITAMLQFDEMTGGDGHPRVAYQRLSQWLNTVDAQWLSSRREQAELLFRRIGITFAVYGSQEATERLIPFDILPRILSRNEWDRLERGLIHRVTALNLFLKDIYGDGQIIKAGIVPADLIYRNPGF